LILIDSKQNLPTTINLKHYDDFRTSSGEPASFGSNRP